jgi:glycosyltransferase involved in cell wall biosynthesis
MARILFVATDTPFFLSHRLPIALAARERGYEVHVAAPESPAAAEIVRHGLQWHRIRLRRRSRNPLRELAAIANLTLLYRRVAPDLVHHIAIKAIVYGTLAARLARVRSVVNAVTGLGYGFGGKQQWLSRVLSATFSVIVRHPRTRWIFQNEQDRGLFIRRGWSTPENSVLIRGSGIDPAVFTPAATVPSGPPLIVFASRLLYSKGVLEFVAAARMLRQRGISARYAVVGAPDIANPDTVPEQVLSRFQTEGDVEVWGFRNDMLDVLRKTTIFCLPTYYPEGVPKVLIEAAACGLPVVTTDTPGSRDIVHDGENGLLVPPRNVEALAEALAALLGDAGLRRRMGAAGRARVISEFTLASVIESTLRIYEDLAADDSKSMLPVPR